MKLYKMLNGARVYSYSFSNIYDSGEVVCELDKGMFVVEIENRKMIFCVLHHVALGGFILGTWSRCNESVFC